MKHVVSFSTGLSSALAVERVSGRYGPTDLQVVFMDTTIEDDDNYRFLHDMQKRWERMGLEIVALAEGRNPYQVATDEKMIFNQRRHPCTRILKIEPFTDYLATLTRPITVHIGFDFAEVHRCEATTSNYKAAGYEVDYPLLWKPYEFRPYPQVAREDWNVDPPRMYELGYSHANCGGVCFAQGIGDWLRTLINFPGRYAEAEEWERGMREIHGLEYAICRDQSNKEVKPRTLQDIREEYEAGQMHPALFQQVSCVHCGAGDFLAMSP